MYTEVEVDITKEAHSRGVFIQRLLKQLYEEGNLTGGLLGEESRKFDYYVFYRTSKMKKIVLNSRLSQKKPEATIVPT